MINRYMSRLIDELRADEVPDPLRERVLAAVWDDLCRLAGAESPPHVRRVLEDPAHGGLPEAETAPAPMDDGSTATQPTVASRSRGGGR